MTDPPSVSSAQALDLLIARWRSQADEYERRKTEAMNQRYEPGEMINRSKMLAFRNCADELQSVLAELRLRAPSRATPEEQTKEPYVCPAFGECWCEHPEPIVSPEGEAMIDDRELRRIRKFWNKPPAPVCCSQCGKEVALQSGPAAGIFGDLPACPHCGSHSGWTSTFTTGGRDAKDDINALLAELDAKP